MEIKKKRRKQRGLPDDMKGWKLKESAALPPSDRPKPASLADQPTKDVTQHPELSPKAGGRLKEETDNARSVPVVEPGQSGSS